MASRKGNIRREIVLSRRTMRIAKARLHEVGLLLVFKGLLEVVYVLFVHPYYGYSGFSMQLNSLKLFESYGFLIFLYLFLPQGEHKISAVGTKLLFVLMVVPTLSLYALKDESRSFLYLFVIGFWLTLLVIQTLPRIRIRKPMGLTSLLLVGIGMLSIGVYGILIKINGLPTLKALHFSKVYEIRRIVLWGPAIMGYLVEWQAKVINPFLISLTWYRRRYFALLAVISLQLLLYLITACKGFLFAPLLVLFLVYAIQKRYLLRLSLIGLITIVSFSYAFYAVTGNLMIPSLFIRRLLFVPPQNYFYYYDFFSKHQLMYLAGTHLNPFLSNPYNMPIPNLIGEVYYKSPSMWVNTGYLGDAYMNFGFLGILLFSVILGIIFIILDSIVAKTNFTVAIGATIMPILALVNGALFTVLGTDGLLLSMLIVWLYSQSANRSATLTARSRLAPSVRKGIK